MTGLTDVLSELRVLFPGDSPDTIRFFAAAIMSEQKGEADKTEAYLDKAIAAEERAKKA